MSDKVAKYAQMTAEISHLLSTAISAILAEMPIEHQTKGHIGAHLAQVKATADALGMVAQVVDATDSVVKAPISPVPTVQ